MLDDPETAAHAWRRFRRIMAWMMLFTITMVIGALVALYKANNAATIHFYIATALGVGLTMLLGSGLMGLVFLSSGTGHDEAVVDCSEDERRR